MGLESLLLCSDAEVLRVLRRVLADTMHLSVCSRPEQAQEQLERHKFDAVIVDCEMEGGPELLQKVRQSSSNKVSLVFAILDGRLSMRSAFDLGADFVLDKPLSLDRTTRSFRAAHNLMIQERRRYFRHAVHMPVWLMLKEGQEREAAATNLSEGGMAIRFQEQMPASLLRVRFLLPGTNTSIEAHTELAWRDSDGRCGLRFRQMSDEMKAEMIKWAAAGTEVEQPLSKVLASPALSRA